MRRFLVSQTLGSGLKTGQVCPESAQLGCGSGQKRGAKPYGSPLSASKKRDVKRLGAEGSRSIDRRRPPARPNILVPVDGSPDADQALTQAIDLAECEHAKLTLLTIVVLPSAVNSR
jgi:hypothetical protein